MLRIGQISYLNCVPFFYHLKLEPDWVLVQDHPKNLGQAARKQKIDAAPLSLIDSFALEDHFEPLDLGISVDGAAQSVLLFSQHRMQDLNLRPIGITPQSATSVELLRLLLRQRYKVQERFVSGEQDCQAHLIIGDQALQRAQDQNFLKQYPNVIDLGQEWKDWQNGPFVFARWMVRASVTSAAKKLLTAQLNACLQNWPIQSQQLDPHFFTPWAKDFALRYLSIFDYKLGAPEQKSITTFRRLIER